jgi:hypothetical protein
MTRTHLAGIHKTGQAGGGVRINSVRATTVIGEITLEVGGYRGRRISGIMISLQQFLQTGKCRASASDKQDAGGERRCPSSACGSANRTSDNSMPVTQAGMWRGAAGR